MSRANALLIPVDGNLRFLAEWDMDEVLGGFDGLADLTMQEHEAGQEFHAHFAFTMLERNERAERVISTLTGTYVQITGPMLLTGLEDVLIYDLMRRER